MSIEYANEDNLIRGDKLIYVREFYVNWELGSIVTVSDIVGYQAATGANRVYFEEKTTGIGSYNGSIDMKIHGENKTFIIYECLEEEEKFLYSVGGYEALMRSEHERD